MALRLRARLDTSPHASSAMTKRILLTGLIWCLTSLPSAACYLVQTKTHGEFKTNGYWRERREVKFYVGDGIVGLPASDIKAIIELSNGKGAPCGFPIIPSLAAEDGQDGIEASQREGHEGDEPKAGPVAAVNGASPATLSANYKRFAVEVIVFERKLRKLQTMSSDELLDLARSGESLKKEMLATDEVTTLNPLLVKVYEALEKIEARIRPE
jgi:hypothetical protein